MVQQLLDSYRQAACGKKLSCYVNAREKHVRIPDLDAASIGDLWAVHNDPKTDIEGNYSLLDVKIELSRRLLRSCSLCQRQCGVDRTAGEHGYCGTGSDSYCFFDQILYGEEAPLIPSHEVFLSGCNMRCKFCYSWQSLENTSYGKFLDPADFAKIIESRKAEGAVNLNLIGGEPTVHLPNILQSLKLLKSSIPILWNSNFYMSEETMRLLDGVIDLYLGDFKFGNKQCALEIGGVEDYFETASRNFKAAAVSSDLIIRHLVLPGHVECCLRPIANWMSKNLPGVPFNLMFQYTPFYRALDDAALCCSLTQEEINEARSIVSSLGLNTCEWNTPLGLERQMLPTGTGEISTTVIIRPDGRVAIMHLHSDLLKVVQSLESGR
ncbi:MAG: radical SAM protein [Armatimonadota bacterium]